MTAALFDELLARRTVPGRPADLTEDLAWVRAASGRAPHSDPRLPLLDESRDPAGRHRRRGQHHGRLRPGASPRWWPWDTCAAPT